MKLALLAIAIFFLQAQEEDPHAGQPETCNNYFMNAHKCQCNHATECPKDGVKQPEDNRCQVYCRHDACKCLHPCTSMGVNPMSQRRS